MLSILKSIEVCSADELYSFGIIGVLHQFFIHNKRVEWLNGINILCESTKFVLPLQRIALVLELVDKRDLKSLALKGRTGSIPVRSTMPLLQPLQPGHYFLNKFLKV